MYERLGGTSTAFTWSGPPTARELVSMGDPRALGRGEDLEEHPYLGGAPKYGERD